MLSPFRLGLGGRLGSGRQWTSWITIDDLVAVILHALGTDSLAGPVNAVSPRPVTNREFTTGLGRVLSRPAILHVPAFLLRLALGQMADELLLASARVEPRALSESGFAWVDPELKGALRRLLSSVGNSAG
jgi:NAD dependent epimerase/dehydratase family enzyme